MFPVVVTAAQAATRAPLRCRLPFCMSHVIVVRLTAIMVCNGPFTVQKRVTVWSDVVRRQCSVFVVVDPDDHRDCAAFRSNVCSRHVGLNTTRRDDYLVTGVPFAS